MCLSIGTTKIINFPFVSNGKLIIFRCSKIGAHYSLIIMCLATGTHKHHHFPFGIYINVVALGVPILKLFRIIQLAIKKTKNPVSSPLRIKPKECLYTYAVMQMKNLPCDSM